LRAIERAGEEDYSTSIYLREPRERVGHRGRGTDRVTQGHRAREREILSKRERAVIEENTKKKHKKQRRRRAG
jgi:hypothetical protein